VSLSDSCGNKNQTYFEVNKKTTVRINTSLWENLTSQVEQFTETTKYQLHNIIKRNI